jgi:hypothetical protein
MISKHAIEFVIAKLSHSECRVPYTYHHDYLRQHVYLGESRAGIAHKDNWTEDELWATCLVEICDELKWGTDNVGSNLEVEDLQIISEASEITENYVIHHKPIVVDIYISENV